MMARDITAANGFEGQINIVHSESQALKVGEGQSLERKADVLVAEILMLASG